LIIGAGPTGLMLASQLSQYKDLTFRIIDKNARATNQSRAIIVHARSLEIFAQLNLIDQTLASGVVQKGLEVFFNGRSSKYFDISALAKDKDAFLTQYPYIFFLEQSITEEILENYLNEQRIEVERNRHAIEIQQINNEFIEVKMDNGEIIRTKYLCACDGAHSFVRHYLNLPFDGQTYSRSLFLVDGNLKNFQTEETRATLFFNNDGLVGLFPMTKNRYRIIGTTEDPEMPLTIESINAKISPRTFPCGIQVENSLWMSMYRVHHRHVGEFRYQKRFFLLGDAAHIHSPVAGQGMNTGLQDALNLGWKLAAVNRGVAKDRLLDTYHDERYAVAKRLVETTDQIFSFVSGRNSMMKRCVYFVLPYLMRWFIQPLFNYSRKFRQNFFRRISQLHISYHLQINSKLSSDGYFSRSIPQPGDRFPYLIFHSRKFHFLIFDQRISTLIDEFVRFIETNYSNLIEIHRETFPLTYPGAFLVRPDGYIAYRTTKFNFEHFQRYFQEFFH